MEYKKKLKQRLFVNLAWAVFGGAMTLYWLLSGTDNAYSLSLGIAFIIMGIIRTVQYNHIVHDKKAMKEQETAEKDERNKMMSERAKSWTFSLSLFVAGDICIILSLLGKHEAALPFAWYVCGMTVVYWICWNIIRKKY
ncbi:MAG: hypothetical protein J6J12_01815 [Oscillospiraceae bacterium]|nr:hypothetical protein [Oscillospiraceae bacterium]